MGLYDTYGQTQLKIHQNMNSYDIGEAVLLSDGVYLGLGGVVVIVGGVFVAEFKTVFDKWGGSYLPKDIINLRNPVYEGVRELLDQDDSRSELTKGHSHIGAKRS